MIYCLSQSYQVQPICSYNLGWGVRLLILKKSPGGTIIPGGTFIRESRVLPDTLCSLVLWPFQLNKYCSFATHIKAIALYFIL